MIAHTRAVATRRYAALTAWISSPRPTAASVNGAAPRWCGERARRAVFLVFADFTEGRRRRVSPRDRQLHCPDGPCLHTGSCCGLLCRANWPPLPPLRRAQRQGARRARRRARLASPPCATARSNAYLLTIGNTRRKRTASAERRCAARKLLLWP